MAAEKHIEQKHVMCRTRHAGWDTTGRSEKVRALIYLGGYPMLAWPGQIKTLGALKNLELVAAE